MVDVNKNRRGMKVERNFLDLTCVVVCGDVCNFCVCFVFICIYTWNNCSLYMWVIWSEYKDCNINC